MIVSFKFFLDKRGLFFVFDNLFIRISLFTSIQKLIAEFFMALLKPIFKKAPPPRAITDLFFFNSDNAISFSNFLKYCSLLFLKIMSIDTPSFLSINL